MCLDKYILDDGDVVFATGVFLIRDKSVKGGYTVSRFEDDTFYEGDYVNDVEGTPYVCSCEDEHEYTVDEVYSWLEEDTNNESI